MRIKNITQKDLVVIEYAYPTRQKGTQPVQDIQWILFRDPGLKAFKVGDEIDFFLEENCSANGRYFVTVPWTMEHGLGVKRVRN